jgi:LuxR family maltose regulon positive regulatory protein
MAGLAPDQQLNGGHSIGFSTQKQDLIRTSLRIVAETLEILQRDAPDSPALIHQLSSHLQQQSEALGIASQSIMASPHGPAPQLQRNKPNGVQLRIYCFGPLQVYRRDEYINLRRTGKGLAILKFLALRPHQPVQRDILLEAIWPGTEPSIARNRLKVAMHHLRHAFVTHECDPRCEGCVILRDGCYLFNPEIEVWTDAGAFESAVQSALRLERSGEPLRAIPLYLQAESLYRGDLLEEDLYEEWTLLRREELKDAYLTILDKLSRYWLSVGKEEDAMEGWKRILAKDPWREDIYRRLMALNARRGQRGLALRWYAMCTRTLQTQLSVAPEAETIALHERILAGGDVSEWTRV